MRNHQAHHTCKQCGRYTQRIKRLCVKCKPLKFKPTLVKQWTPKLTFNELRDQNRERFSQGEWE